MCHCETLKAMFDDRVMIRHKISTRHVIYYPNLLLWCDEGNVVYGRVNQTSLYMYMYDYDEIDTNSELIWRVYSGRIYFLDMCHWTEPEAMDVIDRRNKYSSYHNIRMSRTPTFAIK
mgnify:CR=1 FL=1